MKIKATVNRLNHVATITDDPARRNYDDPRLPQELRDAGAYTVSHPDANNHPHDALVVLPAGISIADDGAIMLPNGRKFYIQSTVES